MYGDLSAKKLSAILGVVSIGAFMDGLDGAIVNVSLPHIAADFNADLGLASLVLTVYFIALSGLMIIFGKASAYTGTKRLFITGIAVFTVSSIFCAASWSIEVLIFWRAVQGVGAAMVAPSAIAIIAMQFPEEMRGRSLGVIAAASALAFALGPVVGGLLTEFLSWHWIFLINLPIGVFTVIAAHYILSENVPGTGKKFDYTGSAIFFTAMALLVVPLSMAGRAGITDASIYLPLLGSLILFTLFVFIEKRAEDPVMEPAMFLKRNFSLSVASYMLMMLAYGGAILLLPFYFQALLEMGPGMAGIFLLVPSVVITVTSPLGGYFSDISGARRVCSLSALVFFISFILMAFFAADTAIWFIIMSLVVMGLGAGPFMSAGSSRIIEHADPNKREIASGIMSTAIYFGSAIGTSLFTAIFMQSAGLTGEGRISPGISSELFVTGYESAFLFGVICCAAVVIFSALAGNKRKTG